MSLTAEQQIAASAITEFLASTDREFVLAGYAGTGKTYTIGHALKGLPRVAYVAPTHKAAGVLREATGQDTQTLHSLLACRKQRDYKTGTSKFSPVFEKATVGQYNVIVVDEASMVGTEMRNWLLEACLYVNTKIIWMGDPCQLPPVNDESVVFSSGLTSAHLGTIMRNHGDIQRAATNVRLHIGDAQTRWAESGMHLYRTENKHFLEQYLERRDTAKMLAWKNEVVEWLNDWVRQQLYTDPLPFHKDERFVVVTTWADHSETTILHSEDELTVRGYTSEQISGLDAHYLAVDHPMYGAINIPVLAKSAQLDYDKRLNALKQQGLGGHGWRPFFELQEQFVSVRPGWATTIHKSQGSTYAQAFVVETDVRGCKDHLTRNMLTYVAYSRAKDELWIA